MKPPVVHQVAEWAWTLTWPEERLEDALENSVHCFRLLFEARAGGLAPWKDLEEIVPGAGNLLLTWPLWGPAPDGVLESLRDLLAARGPGAWEASDPPRLHRIPARYGGPEGPDLEEAAARLGLSAAQLVELHSGTCFQLAFLGFSPGFPYFHGLPPELSLPRRSTPRLRVPAGSIGIAGSFTGIYPQETPGGWHLIARTAFPVFDPTVDPPSPFRVGDRAVFVPVEREA